MYDTKIISSLREKAASLPLTPGVYLMKDASDKIIYVGKSKALRNRVSSYFTDLDRHSVKTGRMVSCVRSFEYILTDTNMEALALENRLIKLYMPKFNIRLKDGKSYPYIKITFNREYPEILFTRRRLSTASDTSAFGRAAYFGPYSGVSTALTLMKTAQRLFGLADCKRVFPRDIGKERPCIYKQLGQCTAPCDASITAEEYREQFRRAAAFLNGSFAGVKHLLTEQMENAAEQLNFESAAIFRDRIKALDACRSKQKIVGSPEEERDVVAFDANLGVTSLSVFFIREGCIVDRENYIFSADELTENEDIVAFLCDLYRRREYIPREVLIENDIGDENARELEEYLNILYRSEREDEGDDKATDLERNAIVEKNCENDCALSSEIAGHGNTDAPDGIKKRSPLLKIRVRIPEKGEAKKLCRMVLENATESARQHTESSKKQDGVAVRLAQLLGLEVVPSLIESYDISNYGADNITAGKIAVKDGKFLKSAYRIYKIKSVDGQDDYSSMREAVERRLAHTEDPYPDLMLLDGGRGHVSAIRRLLEEKNIDIPVFGLVKDEYHKTRAIAGEHEDEEVSIAREQAVFGFAYRLQEEVHRFTVSWMRAAKRKTVKHSSLTEIDGIGAQKAKALMGYFHSITAIKNADIEQLMAVKGITESNAKAIKKYYSTKNDGTIG
ncbi:MAG: excinuclease ABC subunit C [Clostridia bacterium]|nr:excinuclease ABC subunit C [Clostridia bacterium]